MTAQSYKHLKEFVMPIFWTSRFPAMHAT